MTDLSFRPMGDADLALALDWAAAEGWNPGIYDRDPFLAADPAGFLMALVGSEPAGSVAAVRYGADFAFLGLFIVRPEFRGRGVGSRLWTAALEHAGRRTVGLDGVVARQESYRRKGFETAYRTVRFAGSPHAPDTTSPNIVELRHGRPQGLKGMITLYDRSHFPGPRDDFMRVWLEPPGRRTLAFVQDSVVRGYGCVRPCRSGYKLGPLFADTPEIARRLCSSLVARHRKDPVFIDVPEPNRDGTDLAESFGLSPVFETARMYRGTAPSLPLSRIFGVTTLELG